MYKNILVPIDLSHPEQGHKILQLARTIGGPDARLTALFVAGEVPSFVAAELPEHLLDENRANAAADLKALADAVGAATEVRTGHASTVILEEANKLEADLIVVASHRPGLEDYFLGSTAARVVRHSDCAVLVDR